MKQSIPLTRATALAGAVLAVLAAGCSRTDDPPLPGTVPPAQTQLVPSPIPPGTMSTPTLPTGTLPDPVVPKDAPETGTPVTAPTASSPAPTATLTPGQVNDQSRPAFKDGGTPDPNK